jgi:hypothetical protein
MKTKITFEKESSGKWYAVLPEWEGPHAALQMVAGADTLLDDIVVINSEHANTSPNSNFVTIDVEPDDTDDHDMLLEHISNGDYVVIGAKGNYTRVDGARLWLCGVTTFVFGYYPLQIAFKVLSVHEDTPSEKQKSTVKGWISYISSKLRTKCSQRLRG